MLSPLIHRSKRPEGCEPIRAGAELLAAHRGEVSVLTELVGVPQPVFQTFYWETLAAYAAFVQTMPVSQERPDRALLDDGLLRAIRALNRRRGYLLPPGAEAEVIAAEADIWTYAVFLASLLQGIGKPAIDRKVILLDRQRRCLGRWEPCAGAMTAPASGYRMSFIPTSNGGLARRLVPLLVPHIVPAAGLKWLWSNPTLLACWVGAISGDARSAGLLGEIIELPCHVAESLEPCPTPRSPAVSPGATPTASGTAASAAETPEATAASEAIPIDHDDPPAAVSGVGLPGKPDDPGRQFLAWLQEGMGKGEIAVNRAGAHVHRVPEGLLLVSPGIFRDYDEQRWHQVQKAFLKLRLHRKSGPGDNFVTYRIADHPSSTMTGLLIPDPRVLWGDRPVPAVNPGLIQDDRMIR